MTIRKTVFVFVCVYAPQANLSEFEKDRFYQMLQCTVAKIPASEQLFVCGDWNGHIGSQSTGFEEVHGGQAIGKRNTEGERVLEFVFANELVVGNTWFKKKPEHLVTYQSGNAATQIDFILYRRSFRKQVSNVKVILGEKLHCQSALRDACHVRVSSRVPDVLGLLGLLMEDKPWRLRLGTKSSKLSQSSATLGTCSLQEVGASWLQSHTANVHGASSGNCFPFSPTAPSDQR